MRHNTKGSILLYVLFLSSFLILFFISFQGELEKMLEGAQGSTKNIQDNSSIQDALILLKNTPAGSTVIDSNNNISLISLHQSGTIFSESLSGSGSEEYWITSSGGSSSMTLTLTLGGPISYRIAAFNSGSEISATLISSGVITSSGTMNLSGSLDTHILVIDPLGGYVQYTINTGMATIIPSSSQYRRERNINGYKKEEGVYNIVNFIPKTRTNFDYGKIGMYLKE